MLVKVAMGTATEVRDACGELKKNGQLAPLVVVNRGQELVTAKIDHGHGATMEADNILPGPGQVSLRGKTWDTSPEGWYPRYTIYS